MIFHQPIILASELVTHAVLIVLMGVIVVEYFVQKRQDAWCAHAFYAVAAMTVFGAVWVFLDFFASLEAPFILFLRYALLLGIIALVLYMMRVAFARSDVVYIPKKLGIALVAVILIFILFDVLYHATGMPSIGLLYALFRIIGVTTYYLFIMQYLIMNDSHERI